MWGEVVEGMDVADAISTYATESKGGMKMLKEAMEFSIELVD